MILTDVIVTKPLPPQVRPELTAIGLDYLCEGTQSDFRDWMVEAGLINVGGIERTAPGRNVWEYRRTIDLTASHQKGYSSLLDDQQFGLGEAIFYIYVRGERPKTQPME